MGFNRDNLCYTKVVLYIHQGGGIYHTPNEDGNHKVVPIGTMVEIRDIDSACPEEGLRYKVAFKTTQELYYWCQSSSTNYAYKGLVNEHGVVGIGWFRGTWLTTNNTTSNTTSTDDNFVTISEGF